MPGLHLAAPYHRYCRQGTGDADVIARLSGRRRGASTSIKATVHNFSEIATQALEVAVMNKCRLTTLLDPGGLSMMLLDDRDPNFGSWSNRIRNQKRGNGRQTRDGNGRQTRDGNGRRNAKLPVRRGLRIGDDESDTIGPVQVSYQAAYCHHHEDGTFWFELLCAIINRLLKGFPGLKDFIQQHGDAIRNGQQEVFQKRQYRALSRSNSEHQLAHRLYTNYTRIYNHNANRLMGEILRKFGGTVRQDRQFDEFKVCELLKRPCEDGYFYSPALVYKVSNEANNSGKLAILKPLPPEHGSEFFLNEVKVYEYLKTIPSSTDKLWPELFEFGSLTMKGGAVMFYLLLEYIHGKSPSMNECRKCEQRLRKLGVYHGDVDPRNFVRIPSQK